MKQLFTINPKKNPIHSTFAAENLTIAKYVVFSTCDSFVVYLGCYCQWLIGT
jgi:hypothetical protein